MPVPLTDNWAYGNPMPAMPAETTGGVASGGTGTSWLKDLMGKVSLSDIALMAGVIADKRSTGLEKMMALDNLFNRREQQQQQQQLNQFGSELASILDSGVPAEQAQTKISELIKSYSGKIPLQTLMETSSGFMKFKNSQDQAKRAEQEFGFKLDEQEKKERQRKAEELLTKSVPDPAMYQPGSFKQLGIGSPTGKPSEAPSQAAPGKTEDAFQRWMQIVRTTLPPERVEPFITARTGVDPELQRQTASKSLIKSMGGAGALKPSQLQNQLELKVWQKYMSGEPLSVAEQQLIGTYKDPTGMAFRATMANPMIPIQMMSGQIDQQGLAELVAKSRQALTQAMSPQAAVPVPRKEESATGTTRSQPAQNARAMAELAKNVPAGRPFRVKGDKQWYVKQEDGSIVPVTLKQK